MYPEKHWLLPEGIDEVLPPTAWQLEQLRRPLLDLYHSWGYELVSPPFVEYLDSLLIGTGSELDLQTFKLIDQLNGRTLGVRADMTPQVARIDAQQSQDHPTRLCYMGTVLHTRGDGFGGSRAPIQFGAELYGHAGLASDLEILSLLLTSLEQAALSDIHLDLGHVAIFRSLVGQSDLSARHEAELFAILQHKALPELCERLEQLTLPAPLQQMLLALADLNGGPDVLECARQILSAAPDEVHQALDTLEHVVIALQRQWPTLPVHIDLAELRGYRYHTGLVFAAYMLGQGQEMARGGRYDYIGQVFGRARPATGFSADLKKLLLLGRPQTTNRHDVELILAPAESDPALEHCIRELRRNGRRVVRTLPGGDQPAGCKQHLVYRDKAWQVVPLDFNRR